MTSAAVLFSCLPSPNAQRSRGSSSSRSRHKAPPRVAGQRRQLYQSLHAYARVLYADIFFLSCCQRSALPCPVSADYFHELEPSITSRPLLVLTPSPFPGTLARPSAKHYPLFTLTSFHPIHTAHQRSSSSASVLLAFDIVCSGLDSFARSLLFTLGSSPALSNSLFNNHSRRHVRPQEGG
jgi:hypothetical protein